MPWFGLTDLGGGLLVIMETPEGAGVIPRVEGSIFAPQVYWEPSRETLRYARKLHYRLLTTPRDSSTSVICWRSIFRLFGPNSITGAPPKRFRR
jgi:hypothetical protein